MTTRDDETVTIMKGKRKDAILAWITLMQESGLPVSLGGSVSDPEEEPDYLGIDMPRWLAEAWNAANDSVTSRGLKGQAHVDEKMRLLRAAHARRTADASAGVR